MKASINTVLELIILFVINLAVLKIIPLIISWSGAAALLAPLLAELCKCSKNKKNTKCAKKSKIKVSSIIYV